MSWSQPLTMLLSHECGERGGRAALSWWTKHLQHYPSPPVSGQCLSLNFVSHLPCKKGTTSLWYKPAPDTSHSAMPAFTWATCCRFPCAVCRLLMWLSWDCLNCMWPCGASSLPAQLQCSPRVPLDAFSCSHTCLLATSYGILSQVMLIFRRSPKFKPCFNQLT